MNVQVTPFLPYQFKDKRITVIPYEEVTVEMQRYYNSNGATMIPLKRSAPKENEDKETQALKTEK